MSPSNLQLLTRSHPAIASKKRAKSKQLAQILFDDSARREFLTGFHKRKLAKADAARKKALDRQKQELLEARREKRRTLRERARENAALVEKAYGAPEAQDQHSSDEGEWSGIAGSPPNAREDEYGDEETLATVTVIEDFDPELAIYGRKPSPPSSDRPHSQTPTKPRLSSSTASQPQNKPKPKKTRYEGNRARKSERQKQHSRKLEKAALAGGKSSRNNTNRKNHSSQR
ncbi:hypothetical protein BDN72DRAFT_886560, partial [Pluteus cervinus]